MHTSSLEFQPLFHQLVYFGYSDWMDPGNKAAPDAVCMWARDCVSLPKPSRHDGKKPASGGSQTGKLGDVWISDMLRAQCSLGRHLHANQLTLRIVYLRAGRLNRRHQMCSRNGNKCKSCDEEADILGPPPSDSPQIGTYRINPVCELRPDRSEHPALIQSCSLPELLMLRNSLPRTLRYARSFQFSAPARKVVATNPVRAEGVKVIAHSLHLDHPDSLHPRSWASGKYLLIEHEYHQEWPFGGYRPGLSASDLDF
jgi:hypothetical protein